MIERSRKRQLYREGARPMNTVTKRDLVQRISENTKVQQQKAKEVIQGFLDEIIAELASGNRLEFRDFGVFEPKAKAPRTARNPRTGARIQVPEKITVKFKAGRMMKEKMQPTPKPEATPPDPGLPQTGSSDASSAPAP
ncbi:MAG: HU family DNA-binding protein [Planctomycetota bacterium]